MLPLRDRNPTSRRAWVTLALIGGNVLAFLVWQPTFEGVRRQDAFYFCNALVPYEVTHATNLTEGGEPARRAVSRDLDDPNAGPEVQRLVGRECPRKTWALPLLVAMFLHAGWLHLGGNMLFLWVFGNNVEDRLGHLRYLAFYLAGGVAASALQIAFDPGSAIPNLGASGAIAAVLGAYIVMFPRARVLTLVFLFVPVWVPAFVVLGSWFVLQFFDGVGGLGTDVNSGVASWAHVGGFVAGVVGAWLLFPRGAVRPPAAIPPRPDAAW